MLTIKAYYYIISIIILILLNIGLVFKLLSRKDECSSYKIVAQNAEQALNAKVIAMKHLENDISKLSSAIRFSIPKESIIETEEGVKKQVRDILPKKNINVIFRLNISACDPCYNKFFSRINKYAKIVGRDRIAIISSEKYKKDFEKRFNTHQIKTYFVSRELPLSLDKGEEPFMFTIDKHGNASNVFIPHEESLDDINNYMLQIFSTP